MSELDINDQKANRQNNPEGGNNAQCHVYSHVDSIGHDAGYGLIFGRVWSRPINVRTAFQIQSTGDTGVFSNTLLLNATTSAANRVRRFFLEEANATATAATSAASITSSEVVPYNNNERDPHKKAIKKLPGFFTLTAVCAPQKTKCESDRRHITARTSRTVGNFKIKILLQSFRDIKRLSIFRSLTLVYI